MNVAGVIAARPGEAPCASGSRGCWEARGPARFCPVLRGLGVAAGPSKFGAPLTLGGTDLDRRAHRGRNGRTKRAHVEG